LPEPEKQPTQRLQRESALAVINAARVYRAAEQAGTPRMWRGKALQDLASALDDALEAFDQRHGLLQSN
jgi:hypothetical protein